MSLEFPITSFIVVASSGTGAPYTLAAGLLPAPSRCWAPSWPSPNADGTDIPPITHGFVDRLLDTVIPASA